MDKRQEKSKEYAQSREAQEEKIKSILSETSKGLKNFEKGLEMAQSVTKIINTLDIPVESKQVIKQAYSDVNKAIKKARVNRDSSELDSLCNDLRKKYGGNGKK